MKPDTPNRYGTVTRFLHWTMALCMVWMVFSALIPDALTDKSAQAFFRNGHKQVGSLLFVLIIVRLAGPWPTPAAGPRRSAWPPSWGTGRCMR